MLVLLHGFTGGPQSWHAVIRALEDDKVLVPALVGHEPAWNASKTTGFHDEVRRLGALIASHPGKHHLCGYSLGARLALALMVEYPWLFSGASLIGVHPGLQSDELRHARLVQDAELAVLLRTRGIEHFVDVWEGMSLFQSQRSLDKDIRMAQREVRLCHDARGLAQALDAVGLGQMPDYRKAARCLSQPITLMTGQLDTKFSAFAEQMQNEGDHRRWISVPEAGHNVVLEKPSSVSDHLNQIVGSEGEGYRS